VKISALDFRDLRTPRQIGEANPAIRPSIRWWLECGRVATQTRTARPAQTERAALTQSTRKGAR
jgi:hypothetical protein